MLKSDPVRGAAGVQRMLLFTAGGRLFGCDIAVVREIIPARRATRLPGSPAYVLGLINLRGTVVTVIDLVARLGAGTADARDGSIIMVEWGTRAVGLAVDEMRDVQAVTEQTIDAAGSHAAAGLPASSVRGMARTGDNGLAVLLDVQAVVRQVMSTVEEES
jgi:purine-binding chemotaxis protein CheW